MKFESLRLILISVFFLRPLWAADVKPIPEVRPELDQAKTREQPDLRPGTLPPHAILDLGILPTGPGAALPTPTVPPEPDVNLGQVKFDQARQLPTAGAGAPVFSGGTAASVPAVPTFHLGPATHFRAARAAKVSGAAKANPARRFAQALEQAWRRGAISRELKEALMLGAFQDPLTGLFNRSYLEAYVDELAESHPAVATFKLDLLKEINDSQGHEVGNKVLKALAAIAKRVLGPQSVLVRRSPTGFAVLLDVPAARARFAAEALRRAVSRKMGDPAILQGRFGGTISMGVAPLRRGVSPEESYREAVAAAESARALAKDMGGGDRVAYKEDGTKLMDRRSLGEVIAELKGSGQAAMADRLEDLEGQSLAQILAEPDSKAAKPAAMLQILKQIKDPVLARLAFELVYRNPLTGLLNRRYLFDRLGSLLGAYSTYMALDLDKFGDLNAALGEDRADLVLKEFGALLLEAATEEKALALHISGEEFVLLAGRLQPDPHALAERIRQKVKAELGRRVADHGIINPETRRPYEITVSIGVAAIKKDPASDDHTLTLVSAMAESFLQRAKDRGRNRVEDGTLSSSDLSVLLARVVRIDETVRQVLGRLFPTPRASAGAPIFDNAVVSRGKILRALKFNPVAEPGKPQFMVKIADLETISNEIFIRDVIESFEIFNQHLASSRAVAYRRFWPFKPVMVQERFASTHKSGMAASNIPLGHKVALALLAGTFGVQGFSARTFLDVNFSRTVLVDFERARAALKIAKGSLPIGTASLIPWVSFEHLNNIEDYRPALRAWKAIFIREQTQNELKRLMRRAAIPEGRIARDLVVFERNLAVLEASLERDIATANQGFMKQARRAGLSDGEAKALSEVNRAACLSPAGGILRDLAQRVNLLPGRAVPRGFSLSAAEWRRLSSAHPRGLLPEERSKLLELAAQGKLVSPLDNAIYSVPEVRAALDQLDRLLSGPKRG